MKVQFYPAIDVMQGKCVRLLKGDKHAVTVFNYSVENQARQFIEAGATWLHVIDLDGAFAGQSINAKAIRHIVSGDAIKVQLGGGIRTMKDIEIWLQSGVDRVVLGTSAVEDTDFVKRACKKFSGHIAVAIDARSGYVAIEGWSKVTPITVKDIAFRLEDCGVSAIIYTNIERDGTLQGVDVGTTTALANRVHIPVIASGGVSGIEDIYALKGTGIAGVICGRALYQGTLSIKQALKACQGV